MSTTITPHAVPYDKPLPVMAGLTGEFYDWCRRGELRFQCCRACGCFRHVPREMCAGCHSLAWEWKRSSGRGLVFTWTVVARALHPAFASATPYAPVVVELEEGVRVVSEVIDCPPEALCIGMPVQVTFRAVTDSLTLPFFSRASRPP